MKISEALITQGFLDETLQYEAHERVPFFVVDADSELVEGEEYSRNVVDNFYTKKINGVIYAKMDSTHKNFNGTFSGAEPTYSNNMSTARQKLWAEQFELVDSSAVHELERWHNMTFEEQKAEMVKKLKAEKTDVNFEIEVWSDAKGEKLKYVINLKTWSELQTQYGLTGTFAFHDESLTMHEAYIGEAAKQLIKDIALEVTDRDCRYDVWITRATMMPEGDVSMVKNVPISEQEQAYIDTIKAGIEAAFK